MISLPQVTLWTCVCSEDINYYKRVLLVIRHCQKLVRFGRTLLFAHLPPPEGTRFDGDLVQIPKLDLEQFGIFVNKGVGAHIKTDFNLTVHEDGSILDVTRWNPDFLKCDYIGAAWKDGVVGNGGFCLSSQKLMEAVANLPFTRRLDKPYDGQMYPPSDVFVCRVHRKALEDQGIKFASRQLAMEFSSEQAAQKWPTFGYHGRRVNDFRYRHSWNNILIGL